jgi:hypothetical protein
MYSNTRRMSDNITMDLIKMGPLENQGKKRSKMAPLE